MNYPKLRLGIVAGRGKGAGIRGGIVDIQVPNIAILVQILARDRTGVPLPTAHVPGLKIEGHIGKVPGKPPGGTLIQSRGGKRVKPQLLRPGVDILRHGL